MVFDKLDFETFDEDEIKFTNADNELFQLMWNPDDSVWSVTYWRWDERRGERGSHEWLGNYRNLVAMLNAAVMGGWSFFRIGQEGLD